MSTYYDLYTEIKINGKWTCINNVITDIRDNDLVLSRTYESGSRTYFGDASDKLDEIGMQLEAQELSEELLKARPYLLKEKEKGIIYGYPIIGISYKSIKALVPNSKDKENHAFVLKDTIFAYEHGELDSIWDYLSSDEYEKLSKEAKKAYTYYEWNDETGWYYFFCKIIEHVDWQLYEWKSINYFYDEEPLEACLNQIKTKYVRLPDLLMEYGDASFITGHQKKLLTKYGKIPLLIIDEWLVSDISDLNCTSCSNLWSADQNALPPSSVPSTRKKIG